MAMVIDWKESPACCPGQSSCQLEGRRRRHEAWPARTLRDIVKLETVETVASSGAIGQAREDGRVEKTSWRRWYG